MIKHRLKSTLQVAVLCRFDSRESGFRAGDTQAVLKGRTKERVPVLGTDSIRVESGDF